MIELVLLCGKCYMFLFSLLSLVSSQLIVIVYWIAHASYLLLRKDYKGILRTLRVPLNVL